MVSIVPPTTGMTLLRYSQAILFSVVLLTSSLLPIALASSKEAKDVEVLHVLGVVAAIDAKRIDVKTANGPVVSVLFGKQVKFKNKNNPKSIDPPAVGDRIIIEAAKDDKTKKVTAMVVHYSPIRITTPDSR